MTREVSKSQIPYNRFLYEIDRLKKNSPPPDELRKILDSPEYLNNDLLHWKFLCLVYKIKSENLKTQYHSSALALLREVKDSSILLRIHLRLIIVKSLISSLKNNNASEAGTIDAEECLDQCWLVQEDLASAIDAKEFQAISHEAEWSENDKEPNDFQAWEMFYIDREFKKVLMQCLDWVQGKRLKELMDHFEVLIDCRKSKCTEVFKSALQKPHAFLLSMRSEDFKEIMQLFSEQFEFQKTKLNYLSLCKELEFPAENEARSAAFKQAYKAFKFLYHDYRLFSISRNLESDDQIVDLKLRFQNLLAVFASLGGIEIYTEAKPSKQFYQCAKNLWNSPIKFGPQVFLDEVISFIIARIQVYWHGDSVDRKRPHVQFNPEAGKNFISMFEQIIQSYQDHFIDKDEGNFFGLVTRFVLNHIKNKIPGVDITFSFTISPDNFKNPFLKNVAELLMAASKGVQNQKNEVELFCRYLETSKTFKTKDAAPYAALMRVIYYIFQDFFANPIFREDKQTVRAELIQYCEQYVEEKKLPSPPVAVVAEKKKKKKKKKKEVPVASVVTAPAELPLTDSPEVKQTELLLPDSPEIKQNKLSCNPNYFFSTEDFFGTTFNNLLYQLDRSVENNSLELKEEIKNSFLALFCSGFSEVAFWNCVQSGRFALLFPQFALFPPEDALFLHLGTCCHFISQLYLKTPTLSDAFEHLRISHLLALFFCIFIPITNDKRELRSQVECMIQTCNFALPNQTAALVTEILLLSQQDPGRKFIFFHSENWLIDSYENNQESNNGLWIPPSQ